MKHDALKGATGILATGGGIALNHAEINSWLQTISLCVGIAVGIATFFSIVLRNKSKNKKIHE